MKHRKVDLEQFLKEKVALEEKIGEEDASEEDTQLECIGKIIQHREIKKFDVEFIEEGLKFFMKFWNNHDQFFDKIEEVLAAEKFLWSIKGGGYAGTVDNVSRLINQRVLIIDYKNSRKPKKDDWIQDYYLQAAAYFVAFWERTGIRPMGAEIWIANEIDECPQIFTLTEKDIKYYFAEFQKRLAEFKQSMQNI